ncbi:NAD(P)-binding protein [Calidifontibacter sp. DB0510]|uniref:NAD(P)-binding protein n=1 Tax=Metallococcus carri TaxID=1656884 RepID=A0A967EEZ5_9MICO|nr:FAD-dependent oxidoreductase [Metallococcus carri]NHN56146.1 NAD(P)-binding protein [Metallococcus carri]NOP38803.1 NAD(P)-binding protein [Calidifontibacter sp. DB2511S]
MTTTVSPGARIAVVGAGVSGLTAVHLLARSHEVTLFEAQERLGGHAHTHTVDGLRVDSGFIVHNDRTYPLLTRLFNELGVQVRDTEMSMSIRDEQTGLEYAGGRGAAGFVARPRQLADRDYWSMLLSVKRFHREAQAFLGATDDTDQTTFGEFVRGYPEPFVRWYAVPLVACVWSSGTGVALDYPARYLFRFLQHHGMLDVTGSPQWRTVVGGSATYVERVAARLQHVRRGEAARTVTRHTDGVTVATDSGSHEFDRVVIATHADEALALLADPTPAEKDVLGAFRYSRNATVLHSDLSLLPRATRARASWNFLVGEGAPVVTYWMNRLQGLPDSTPLLVTLNAADRIDPAAIVARMDYEHPIYDLAAVRAQRLLPTLATEHTVYAGAYHGWGFHEDGCRSGVGAVGTWGVLW